MRYANGNDFKIVGEYCDAGKSGKNMAGRPQFKQMLDDIEFEMEYDITVTSGGLNKRYKLKNLK